MSVGYGGRVVKRCEGGRKKERGGLCLVVAD